MVGPASIPGTLDACLWGGRGKPENLEETYTEYMQISTKTVLWNQDQTRNSAALIIHQNLISEPAINGKDEI